MEFSPSESPHFQQGLVSGRRVWHTLVFGLSGLLVGGLFLLYVVGLQCLGIFIGWGVVLTAQAAGSAKTISWQTVQQLCFLGFASSLWLGMLRPLRRCAVSLDGDIIGSENSQPRLFRTLKVLARALGAQGAQRVLFDGQPSIRSVPPDRVISIFRGESVIRLGLPLVAVLSARELAACLAMKLSPGGPGLGGLALRWVLGLDAWFQRSLKSDADLNPLKAKPYRVTESPFRFFVETLLWVSQRPFWMLSFLSSGIGKLARYLDDCAAHAVGVQLIGRGGLEYLMFKSRLIEKCWRKVSSAERISKGAVNWTQAAVLQFIAELEKRAPFAARAPLCTGSSGAPWIAFLPPEAPGSEVIHDFEDLAVQVTHAERGRFFPEIENQKRWAHSPVKDSGPSLRQAEALTAIKRYFGGLMHPERSLCGLGPSSLADPETLKARILKSRLWEKDHGSKMRTLVKEWNEAWRKRRDMDSAWVSTVAGFYVCRLEGDGVKGNVELYRRESAAQKAIMAHLEDAIRLREARLEQRFTSALGLLWTADPSALPLRLREMRQALPLWGSVYDSISGVLPEFRELLTDFHTFQTLVNRIAGVPLNGATGCALQAVVPGLINRARRLLSALDGACYPFGEGGIVISMEDYLCKGAALREKAPVLNADAGMLIMAQNLVIDTGASLTPFVSRFLELQHLSFSWLTAAAEAAEMELVGPAELREFHEGTCDSFARLIMPAMQVNEREKVFA